MKLQHIAAAVALTVAGTANATMATGGNGSMVLIAYDKTGGTTTAGMFDLGLTLDDFVGATGNGTAMAATSLSQTAQSIEWDFNANTLKINGAVSTTYGSNDWTAAWNRLLANSDAADLQFVVTAFDTVGFGANKRALVTGVTDPTAQQLANSTTQASNLAQIAGAQSNDIFTPQNGSLIGAPKGTHGTAANGAYTFTAEDGAATRANGYAMAGDAFGNNWRNFNTLNGETFAGNSAGLWLVDGLAKETMAPIVASLDVAGGKLSFTPAVPEPETYGLAIAGLAMVGLIARRRRAA